MSKLNLTEATMLALQGKLEESKPVRQSRANRKLTKKQENIDINVDEKTAVSVMGNETIVDTEDATIIVDKKEDEFVPETSTDLPMEAPEEDVVEVPVEGDETIIPEDEVPVEQLDELPVEQTDEDEAVLDAKADVDLPLGDATEEDEDNAVLDAEADVDLPLGDATEDEEDEEEDDDEDKEESKKVESKSKKEEDFDENAYKSSNLFKALCDEITDIVVEDDEQPTQEQIEQAVDVVINGYDYIWEDLHTALRTEIDKVTGKGDGDEYQPRYEAKSHRKSLGTVTEAKTVKYSSKSFKEALTKFYTSNTKTIESVELTKFDMTRNTIKMEAKLTNKDGMTATKILEMKQVAQNKNFTKYAMQEVSKLKKENKSNITMLVSTNNNILECKYIRK